MRYRLEVEGTHVLRLDDALQPEEVVQSYTARIICDDNSPEEVIAGNVEFFVVKAAAAMNNDISLVDAIDSIDQAVFDPSTRAVTVFAHHDGMNQPNDLAMAADGTLYASDPNWKDGTGQLWRIDRDGRVERLAEGMGTTNGIEVGPDGRVLYVNESVQRNVWA